MTVKNYIVKFNEKLAEYDQQVFATEMTGNHIRFSNGVVLDLQLDVNNCKRRVMHGCSMWVERFDRLYGLDLNDRLVAEAECRFLKSSLGGKAAYSKHGDEMRQRLNVGIPWNKGTRGQNVGNGVPCSEEKKKKIGRSNRGAKNGMFGSKMSAEDKQLRSETMKDMILRGEFTPNSNNRNTYWGSSYGGKLYRSSWEALYQFYDPEAVFEQLRIPYEFDGVRHIYIVDFINHQTKTVVEVKPLELLDDPKTQAKILSVQTWCDENGYEFLIADQNYFLNKKMPENFDGFDFSTAEKIRRLYETSK